MLHEPAAKSGPDPAFPYKRRLGAWMFVLYALVYAGFVVVNLVRPGPWRPVVFGGLNLAVVYGFGLIIFALVLALVYNRACGRMEKRLPAGRAREGGHERPVHRPVRPVRRLRPRPSPSTSPAGPSRPAATTPPAAASTGASTASPSPATTCRRPPSSASAA
ncbi:MAG: DUF485 domain-containing protein [Comamonadaceae bacterium]|nr:DUF485 domain-containing protein [Comamonadaceae bacterium]